MAHEQIIIAGKSGVGRSTIAVNLSAALACEGRRVAHVGHDPDGLSTAPLRGEPPLDGCRETALGRRDCGVGYRGILCLEAGMADGDGQRAGLERVGRLEAVAAHRPEFVVHDIPGTPEEVFASLSGWDGPWRLFVVTTADMHALRALNGFIGRTAGPGCSGGRLGGVIANNLTGPFSESMVADFVRKADVTRLITIPRSLLVHVSEFMGLTVLEAAPRSHLAMTFRRMAQSVARNGDLRVARPLTPAGLADWARKWSDIITELETGDVRDGAAI